jgi:hypothetical protein
MNEREIDLWRCKYGGLHVRDDPRPSEQRNWGKLEEEEMGESQFRNYIRDAGPT